MTEKEYLDDTIEEMEERKEQSNFFENVEPKTVLWAASLGILIYFAGPLVGIDTKEIWWVLILVFGLVIFFGKKAGVGDRLITDKEAKALVTKEMKEKQKAGSTEFGFDRDTSEIEILGTSDIIRYNGEPVDCVVGISIKKLKTKIPTYYTVHIHPYDHIINGFTRTKTKFKGDEEPDVVTIIPKDWRLKQEIREGNLKNEYTGGYNE